MHCTHPVRGSQCGPMARILIADDHSPYRRGLCLALASARPDIQVLEATSLDEVLAHLEQPTKVDLVLVDLHMNGQLSLSILSALRDSYPDTAFVIISTSEARSDILHALDAGLHGFISKAQSDGEIMSAICDVLSGRIYVPRLLLNTRAFGSEDNSVSGQSVRHQTIEPLKLTMRQRDVLDLLAEGLSNKEIARRLKIAEATTKIHVAALMRALGVRNRTEAALLVRSWVDHGDEYPLAPDPSAAPDRTRSR
jgi:DNA-binding NarL/FixJ family response regulator